MKDALIEKYDEFKSVLDVMPTNNKNNKQKKYEFIKEEEIFNEKFLKLVLEEIERRKSRLEGLVVNEAIAEKEAELNGLLPLVWNEYNTSYEKLELDYYLYKLSNYKDNLAKANECIRKIIDNFNHAGIEITSSMFNYNKSVKEYIEIILSPADEELIKTKFEELYWKYPELIKTIEINFKGIYLKNKKAIDKYYDSKYSAFLSNNNVKEISDNIIKLSEEIKILKDSDLALLFNEFRNKEYSLATYSPIIIDKKRNNYFGNNFSYNDLVKLYKSLKEYNLIVKYDYILNDMKTRLENKDTYKGKLDSCLKELSKIEEKLISLSGLSSKKSIIPFIKKKPANDEKTLFEYKSALNDLINKFNEFDDLRFNDLIYKKLEKDSSIFTVFKLVSGNYLYFLNRVLENVDGVSVEEVDKMFEELNKQIISNNFNLLENTALLDEKQMKEIIVDRYRLDSINISTTDLEKDNLENTIEEIKTLLKYENIVRSGIKFEDVEFILECDKM